MPDLNATRELRNGLLAKMSALATAEVYGAEQRSQFDAMNADVAIHEGDIARLEITEKFEAEQRSAQRPNRNQPGAPIEGDNTSVEERNKNEKRAFESYIKHGNAGMPAEQRSHLRENRDITTGTSGANGGALVPQLFHPVLTDALKFYGPVSTLVGQKRTTGGQPLKIALDNDTANSLTILGETVAVSEVDPAFASQILSTDTVTTGIVKITLQELADSYFDIESWLRTKFGQRYGRGLEAQITSGNGSNVASLITSAHAGATALGNTLESGATGANSIGYDDVVALFTALDPAYIANATWMMNSATRGFLMGVKDGFGRPLFIPNPTSGAFDTLLGRPVVLNQALPNIGASAAGTILFGDLAQGYLFRTDGDLSIVRLSERFMDTLEVGFIGYARIGGISMDAGTHPIQKLTQSAS
jgi:HK97 family phage major capsid protein